MLTNLNKEEISKRRSSRSGDNRILSEISETLYKDMVVDGGCEDGDLETTDLNITMAPKKGAFMKKLFEASVLLANQLA